MGHKLLHAHTGERIELSYDIVPQQTEWFRHPQEHMAIINTDYFLFNTENALVFPAMLRIADVEVTFDWRALHGMKEAAWKSISHSSGDGYELSYERGAAIALWADATIRSRSSVRASLDNVMLDLVHQSQTADPPPDFTEERVLAAFSPYLSMDEMRQLRNMAVDGADVPLPKKLGSCAVLQNQMQAVVNPGFDTKASVAAKRAVGVIQDGPAYRAGIRNGQTLFDWSIYYNDPSKDALLGVVMDGQKKKITFSPKKMANVEQYRAIVENVAAKSCTPF